jgi:hypothetical protein
MAVDMERLLDAVRQVESGGNPNAVSPKGAKGPYQFMDATAAEYGVKNPFDENQSREGARKYLNNLYNQFGTVEHALAAYNGGPGRLSRRGNDIGAMPPESQDYVQKVMALYGENVAGTSQATHEQFNTHQQPASAADSLFPSVSERRRKLAGELFTRNRENDSLSESILNPKPVNEAQRIYQMQLRTGMPVSVIERNLEEIEKQVAKTDFDAEKFRSESPLLAQWLAQNPTRAALAQGDYENLSFLEKSMNVFKAVPVGIEQGVKKERMMILGFKAVTGDITAQEEIERQKLKLELQDLGQEFEEGAPSWTKAAADVIGMQIPMAIESSKYGLQWGLPTGAAAGGALGLLGGPGAPVTVTAGAAAGGVTGFKSVAGAKYLELTYQMAVGEAFDDLEEVKDADGNPIDPVAARYASMLVGVPNSLMEFASLRMAIKVIPGADKILGKLTTGQMKQILAKPSVAAALKDFGGRYAAAVGTETFTEGMQKMMNILAREAATGDLGAGVSGQDAEAIAAESAQAFKASVVLGALGSGPKVVELYSQMAKAEQNEQFMLDLGDAVANSSTYANSQEALTSYINHLKENGPIKNVFVPIEKWDLLFQDGAETAATEVFGNNEQYQEAKATGGDLVIPLETYAGKLAGTQFHEQLIPDVRLGPGEMTPNEALMAEQAEPEILAGLQAEMDQTIATEAPLQEIYSDVFQKLRDVGMGNTEANRNATLWREHIRGMSDLTGLSPQQLYSEQPLTVQREFVQEQVKKYNQQLAEPAVATPNRLPLEGGEINLPPASEVETTAAVESLRAAKQSDKDYGAFGATFHPTKGNMAGTEGVAVAGYPQRGVVTDGAPTAEEIETFMRRNRDIFKADPNAALGLWVDSESGKGYIDIANVLPREVAIEQGEQLGEIAVWDLAASEEIRLPVARDTGQQTLFQGERGASVPSQKLIALLKGADPSTFAHESAHLWFEELRVYGTHPDANEQTKKYWETAKEWTGATDDAISTESHEMFARGFEAYLYEGKAPSFQLREVFAQFMDWMMRIYKSMTMLDVELTPEVRDMMDHLIATDEAIKQNREYHDYDTLMFDDSMMTTAEAGAYNQLIDEARAEANDSFRAKVFKELRREKTETWRKEKKALEPKVRKEILEIPIYRAAYWLWSGKLPDGTVIPDMAATKLDKQSLLDLGVTLTDLPFRYQENGLSPDVVAEHFGFSSGESFVRELVGLPTLKKAVDEEVSRRIREEHGGIIVEGTTMEEAAMEVQNTRQIDVFNMELRLLKRLGARREKTHPAILKDIARQIIGRKTFKEADPRIFEEAAAKAGQEAQDAMLGREFRSGTGRNLDVAFDAKTKQMLNIFLFKEATAKRQDADKHVRKWKKFLSRSDQRLAKNYNMDMVNTARAIASVHGIGSAQENAATYMRQIKEYDEQTYLDMQGIVDMASSDGRTMDDLTIDDFAIVRDAIEGLWKLARRTKQVEIDGKLIDKKTVVGTLNARIAELVRPRKRAGYNREKDGWDKTKMGLLGAKAMLRRVEHWVDAMDDGDPNGPFRTLVWQPISEAADTYRDMRVQYLKKYEALAKTVPEGTFKSGKIEAPEINFEFKDITRLVGAMMHTGNQSNLQKLLVGREWGAFDSEGNLDSRKWDQFVKRMQDEGVLTKAHMDFVQGVWDLMEEMKPAAQKAHKEMYGYYFNEITAQPITTPFGQYRGGYFPAITDPFEVEDQAIRQEAEALEGRPTSFMFPTTGRGFTRQRSENYNKKLSLDLGLVPSSMEKVLRFTHLEPHVKDIGRVLIDKDFRHVLSALDSEVGSVMLMPWLQRSALQLVEQPSGPRMRVFDQALHGFRTRSGMQIMVANVSVALQQLTGASLAMTKVKPRYFAGALMRYVKSPEAYVNDVYGSSKFMRNRVSTQMMDVQRSIDHILLNPNKYQKAKAFANEHGYFMQIAMQNVVDYATWGGAYEQATKEGHTEKEAVRIADSAVRETQGTFAPEDVSRFEAGTPLLRAFTMFYSFFNMAANLNATEFTKALRKGGYNGASRALYVYAMGFAIPAIVAEAITQAMRGELFDDDDDDGYLDNILSVFLGGQVRMLTPMVPIIGPAVQSGINRFNDKWYDDRINVSPAVSILESIAGTGLDGWRVATEEDARLKRPIKDALTAIGMATGLPLAPLAKPAGYLTDLAQGHIEEPDNPVEFTRGMVSGVAPE